MWSLKHRIPITCANQCNFNKIWIQLLTDREHIAAYFHQFCYWWQEYFPGFSRYHRWRMRFLRNGFIYFSHLKKYILFLAIHAALSMYTECFNLCLLLPNVMQIIQTLCFKLLLCFIVCSKVKWARFFQMIKKKLYCLKFGKKTPNVQLMNENTHLKSYIYRSGSELTTKSLEYVLSYWERGGGDAIILNWIESDSNHCTIL